ncbi:hypothetical protein HDV05_008495, partial [Chytridiales sp. JEL 0842]
YEVVLKRRAYEFWRARRFFLFAPLQNFGEALENVLTFPAIWNAFYSNVYDLKRAICAKYVRQKPEIEKFIQGDVVRVVDEILPGVPTTSEGGVKKKRSNEKAALPLVTFRDKSLWVQLQATHSALQHLQALAQKLYWYGQPKVLSKLQRELGKAWHKSAIASFMDQLLKLVAAHFKSSLEAKGLNSNDVVWIPALILSRGQLKSTKAEVVKKALRVWGRLSGMRKGNNKVGHADRSRQHSTSELVHFVWNRILHIIQTLLPRSSLMSSATSAPSPASSAPAPADFASPSTSIITDGHLLLHEAFVNVRKRLRINAKTSVTDISRLILDKLRGCSSLALFEDDGLNDRLSRRSLTTDKKRKVETSDTSAGTMQVLCDEVDRGDYYCDFLQPIVKTAIEVPVIDSPTSGDPATAASAMAVAQASTAGDDDMDVDDSLPFPSGDPATVTEIPETPTCSCMTLKVADDCEVELEFRDSPGAISILRALLKRFRFEAKKAQCQQALQKFQNLLTGFSDLASGAANASDELLEAFQETASEVAPVVKLQGFNAFTKVKNLGGRPKKLTEDRNTKPDFDTDNIQSLCQNFVEPDHCQQISELMLLSSGVGGQQGGDKISALRMSWIQRLKGELQSFRSNHPLKHPGD